MFGKLLAVFIASILFLGGCGNQPPPDKQEKNLVFQEKTPKKINAQIQTANPFFAPPPEAIVEKNSNQNYALGIVAPPVTTDNKNSDPITIMFFGDMMFDRYIRQVAQKRGNDFIFEGVKNILTGNDLVVANLEGPLTDNASVSVNSQMDEHNNLIFTFPPGFAATLAEKNIKLVNIGNNHILNFGPAGLAKTQQYLQAANVNYFGDTGENERRYWIKEIGDRKIGFVNYNFSIKNSAQKTLKDTKLVVDEADLVVVYTHWGTEYKTGDPGPAVKNLARQFVDAGADLVVGTHPHVVQASEDYQGKKIYYSLGNFIFDQYWSGETQKGLAVKVKINSSDLKMEFEEIPVRMQKSGQTVVTP